MNISEKESAKALYTLFNSLTKAAKEAFIIEFAQKVFEKKALIESNGQVTLIKENTEIDKKQLSEEILSDDVDEDEIGSGD